MYYDTMETGKRIQKLRKAKRLTQEQLAEKINIWKLLTVPLNVYITIEL